MIIQRLRMGVKLCKRKSKTSVFETWPEIKLQLKIEKQNNFELIEIFYIYEYLSQFL